MKQEQIARILARESRISNDEAARQIDRVVHRIVTRLRRGHPVPLPGLGKFSPGRKWTFRFEKDGDAS
jgi:nucleoid DNA-binding protein